MIDQTAETTPEDDTQEPECTFPGSTATYCPEDNKLRLYVGRVPRPDYDRLRAEGWTATPKQGCDFVSIWTPQREDTAREFCGEILDEDQSPEERAADRAERFSGYRDKRYSEATGHADSYDAGPGAHGYQSQARADRAARRHDRAGTRASDCWSRADYWTRRTAGVISHALYRSGPGVRMGRIKELEAELRKCEKSWSEYAEKYANWQTVEKLTDPEHQRKLAHLLAGDDYRSQDYTMPDGRAGSLYRLLNPLDIENAPAAITPQEAAALWLAAHQEPTGETRWTIHLKLRIAYESQMLEAQGGRAAHVEMIPGGFFGKHQVQKVNKSTATGRVVSVNVYAPTHASYDRKGNAYNDETNPRPLTIHTVNVERMPADSYRPPTDEELAAFHAAKAAAKAAAPKRAVPPLINPTEADAERLQGIWNARAQARHAVALANRKTYGEFKPAAVVKISQATYSAASKGSYARAETRALHANAELADRDSNMYCQEESDRRKRLGPELCYIRQTSGGSDWHTPQSVIVLHDKPQKPLPPAVWTVPAAQPEFALA